MRLRRFNNKGVDRFREYLRLAREDATASVQWDLLQDPSLTEEVHPPAEVDSISFQTKREAATYLHSLLREIQKQIVIEDQGLWTWLSLYFFDSLCPKRDGKRAIRNDYTYIYEPRNTRHFYRHLLFISWRILDVAPTYNRLLLDRSISSLDVLTKEATKRLFLTRIPCFFELLEKLYLDPQTNRARKGIDPTNQIVPGDLTHRLPTRIRQLEKTYDLHSLTADQLLDLLGPEFQFESGSR
jgi:hypothetical protein